jgi:hypothetical protein
MTTAPYSKEMSKKAQRAWRARSRWDAAQETSLSLVDIDLVVSTADLVSGEITRYLSRQKAFEHYLDFIHKAGASADTTDHPSRRLAIQPAPEMEQQDRPCKRAIDIVTLDHKPGSRRLRQYVSRPSAYVQSTI